MTERIYVISDLHLGGATAAENDGPDFRMCGDAGLARLLRFAQHVRDEAAPGGAAIRLVLAGDVVDVLAEVPWTAFEADAARADEKLGRILARTESFWAGLRDCLRAGVELTVMIGNHDLEMSLPSSLTRLRGALPGARFWMGPEALRFGPTWIEHGNQRDRFNHVDHPALAAARLEVEAGRTPAFPTVPGSEIVRQIVNPAKERYSFVDLLKPETSAMLPFLALLDADRWQRARTFLAQAMRTRPVADGVDPAQIAALIAGDAELQAHLRAADRAAFRGDPSEIGLAHLPAQFERWWQEHVDGASRKAQRALLQDVLRANAGAYAADFGPTCVGSDDYLAAARRIVEHHETGAEVVIMGHTHHAKVEDLGANRWYLNTGTWADLMRIPAAVLDDDPAVADSALDAFARELATNDLAAHRMLRPTFARVDIDGDRVVDADVWWFHDPDTRPPTRLRQSLDLDGWPVFA